MQVSFPDNLWSAMRQGRFYSVNDLANITGQPTSATTETIRFLTKYGFVNRIGKYEPLFTRSPAKFSPGESINLLRCLVTK